MPNFPSLGYDLDANFMAIVDPASVTHPLPADGQTPWGDTFRLWSGDVEDSLNSLETVAEDLDDRVTALEDGGGGGGGLGEIRSDTTGTHNYMGVAPVDTADSAAGWSVTRISVVPPVVTTHATGAWDDRLTLTYT